MRKILLASAAMLTATAGVAFAQQGPGAREESAYSGVRATAPSSAAGANNNNNITAEAQKGSTANPTPGTFVIRLGGRVNVEVGAGWSNLDSLAIGNLRAKKNPVGVGTWLRLYPGLDAMATNGLRYGAGAEIRTNFTSASATAAPASGGSAQTNAQTLYVRRAFVYLAGDNWGLLRVGQADGTIGLFDGGVTTGQSWSNSGVFNGGDAMYTNPSATAIPFYWLSLAGNEYGMAKLVYVSPKFAGFTASATFAPDAYNQYDGCNVASAGCSNLSSTSLASNANRFTNYYEAGVQYLNDIGPAKLRAYAVYAGASRMGYTGPQGTGLNTTSNMYNDLGIYTAGAAVTYAGFTLAGNYIGGSMNGQLGLKPAGAPNLNATTASLQYVTGPLTLGITGVVADSQGSAALVDQTQLHEYGLSFGGRYVVAPGLAVSADYIYTNRKQNGYNFATGTVNTAANSNNYSQVQGQAFLLGVAVNW